MNVEIVQNPARVQGMKVQTGTKLAEVFGIPHVPCIALPDLWHRS